MEASRRAFARLMLTCASLVPGPTCAAVCRSAEVVVEVVRTMRGLRAEGGLKSSGVSVVGVRQKGEEGLEHSLLLRAGEVRAARMPTFSGVFGASRPTRRIMRVAGEAMGCGGMTSPTTGHEMETKGGTAQGGEAVSAVGGGPSGEVVVTADLASSRAAREGLSLLVLLASATENAGPLVRVLRLPGS